MPSDGTTSALCAMPDPTDIDPTFETAVAQAARNLADEAAQALSDHPETDVLVAYQESRLEDLERQRVRQHVVACTRCADELLQLAAFDVDDVDDAELEPNREATGAAWAAFQEQIGEQPQGAKVLAMPDARHSTEADAARPTAPMSSAANTEPGATAGSKASSRPWWTLAASLVLSLSGLWFWSAGLQDGATMSDQPPANPLLKDLRPDGQNQERDATVIEEITVPVGMDGLILRLNLGDQTVYDAYRAEIPREIEADDQDGMIWLQRQLIRQPAGEFVVTIGRDQLPVGHHRLRLLGAIAKEESVLATYSFQLRYASEP